MAAQILYENHMILAMAMTYKYSSFAMDAVMTLPYARHNCMYTVVVLI